jgi:hypothetical protein
MKGALKQPLTVVLLALNVMLAAWWVVQLWSGTQTAALLAVRPAAMPLPPLISEIGSADTLQAAVIQDRALFYATRRYYVPAPASLAVFPRPDYKLLGTILASGRPTVALLQPAGGTGTRRVKPGDELDGWAVLAVERACVRLRHDADQFEISTMAGNLGGLIATAPMHTAQVIRNGKMNVLGKEVPSPGSGQHFEDPGARLYRPPPGTQ